jgi:hypothetical protein
VKVFYIGNLGDGSAPHSTENHVARALESIGVEVQRVHEQRFRWDASEVAVDSAFVLWTHTHGFAPPRTHRVQKRFVLDLKNRRVPTVAYHLDLWHDLDREHQLHEPFFACDLVCTADGGDEARWRRYRINHATYPPGVSRDECEPGSFRADFASDIAFVGSWQGGYHAESRHRFELVEWLRSTYGDRCRFWPAAGNPAVRGEALRDLYASVKVLVGDSCFSGDPRGHGYTSDRVPETLGRGGLLVHPDTPDVTDGRLYESGKHLLTWPAGDWDALRSTIDGALADEPMRRRVAAAGREHVLMHHTYEARMRTLLADLAKRRLIRGEAAA